MAAKSEVFARFLYGTQAGTGRGAGKFATPNRTDAKRAAVWRGNEKAFALLVCRAVC